MNELQIFNNPEFGEVRTLTHNGIPFAVGVDVTRALEYANPSKAVIDHCKGVSKLGIPSAGGTQETNCIPEGDIYRLIMKAADQSKSPAIKEKASRFESWIFDEVLPSVRKHGLYATPDTVEQMLADPDTTIKLLQEIKSEREKRRVLEAQAEQNAPKVLFADAVATAKTSILVGEMAKLLKQNGVDMGQNRLFHWLRGNGYLIRRQGTDFNTPTQRAMELGLFEIKETTIVHADGHTSVNKTPKVTGKGQQYFVERFLRKEDA